MADHPSDWTSKLRFARDNGLQSAAFHPDGSLAAFTLADAGSSTFTPQAAPETSEERAARMRAQQTARWRTLRAAASGLTPVGPTT